MSGIVGDDLSREAEAWLAADPDPSTRAELQALVEAGDTSALRERFGQRLAFGTAGIRGEQGAGPNRMNRVTVRRMVAGVARHLGPGRHVIIGHDARHNSDVFGRDAANVLASAGIRASLIDGHVPTPVLSFAVPYLGADLGLMVTASHNPRADNGCKVFLADGAELRTPIDTQIEAAIDQVALPPRHLADPLAGGAVEILGREIVSNYVDHIVADVGPLEQSTSTVAYTPLHGVGRDVLLEVFDRGGARPPAVVEAQGDPDPDFPTAAFPNPEEPGVMDAVVALAKATGADLAVANDPDADRLAVAVPDQLGDWRSLTGDEVGALLCDHILAATDGVDRKVVSTVVCSSLVGKLAVAAGVHHRVTLTGFKWIIAEAYADPELRPVFAYEESLGYATSPVVRDKDGLSAALRFVDLTDTLARRNCTPAQRLDELAVEFGLHATRQVSVRFAGSGVVARAGAAVDALRDDPPTSVAGRAVVGFEDYGSGGELPPTNLLRVDLEGGVRVLVRPSGTEPKTKLYFEQVVPVGAVDEVARTRTAALAELDGLAPVLESLLQA